MPKNEYPLLLASLRKSSHISPSLAMTIKVLLFCKILYIYNIRKRDSACVHVCVYVYVLCSGELDVTNLFRIIEGRARDHIIKRSYYRKRPRLYFIELASQRAPCLTLQSRNYFNYKSFIMILPMIDRSVRLCESGSLSCVVRLRCMCVYV